MLDVAAYVRLPAEEYRSEAEYAAHRDWAHERLDAERRLETALSRHGDTTVRDGTCAPCLRRTSFTSRSRPDRLEPNWHAAQTCDCDDRLVARDRLLLHAALSVADLRPWSHLVLLGPGGPLHRRLRAASGEAALAHVPGEDGRVSASDAWAHVIVANDVLHRIAPLVSALADLRRVIAQGGTLLATMPFREQAAATTSRPAPPGIGGTAGSELHAIGWDILPALRAVGWADAAMLRVWSNELGYLGQDHFILRAVA